MAVSILFCEKTKLVSNRKLKRKVLVNFIAHFLINVLRMFNECAKKLNTFEQMVAESEPSSIVYVK